MRRRAHVVKPLGAEFRDAGEVAPRRLIAAIDEAEQTQPRPPIRGREYRAALALVARILLEDVRGELEADAVLGIVKTAPARALDPDGLTAERSRERKP